MSNGPNETVRGALIAAGAVALVGVPAWVVQVIVESVRDNEKSLYALSVRVARLETAAERRGVALGDSRRSDGTLHR